MCHVCLSCHTYSLCKSCRRGTVADASPTCQYALKCKCDVVGFQIYQVFHNPEVIDQHIILLNFNRVIKNQTDHDTG